MRPITAKYLPTLPILALLLAAIHGCDEPTEVVYDEITEANFQPEAGDLAALIAPAYIPFQTVWMGWHGLLDMTGEASDELVTPVRLPRGGWYDGGIYIRLHEHSWDANLTQPRSLWNRAYGGINAANRVIYQLESGTVPVDAESQANTIAELRAVRAYYYSLLMDYFGNIPLVTDFTAVDLPEQRSRAEVFDFVVAELTEVIPALSDDNGEATYGRMNRWAALGILARVYLNAEVYTGTTRWDEVITTADQIIESGRYALEPTYRAPFARDNGQSVENIWVVPYHESFTACANFHMKTLKPELVSVFGLAAQPWGGSSANPQFVETYDPDDGRLADSWLRGPNFDDAGNGYDFTQHIPEITAAEYYHGYPVWKYEVYAGERSCSDVDYPILRYAEVLMMKAEALLRTGQAAAAAALVTQVRERNFMGAAAAKATVTGAELMEGSAYNYGWYDTDGVVKDGPGGNPVTGGGDDVQYGRFLDELGWEFAAEGHRRTHMIRFGVYTTKMWYNHAPSGDYRIIFPIPNSQLELNPNLEQNPGYN